MERYRVIGADYCPFCVKVKNYMDKKKLNYEWIDSETPEGDKIRQVESKKNNHYTIPLVFRNEKFVGGCDDFFAKL